MKSSVAAGTGAVFGDYLYQPMANASTGIARDRRGRRSGTASGEHRGPTPELSRAALTFRAVHAVIAAEMLLAIGYVWWCALAGRRDRLLHIAAATLIGEGVLVTANHGHCPLGGLQERLGDPVPLFELVLSARAAKRAVPTLGAITGAGIALLVARGRREGSAGQRHGRPRWNLGEEDLDVVGGLAMGSVERSHRLDRSNSSRLRRLGAVPLL
jgi:hypothetical protein